MAIILTVPQATVPKGAGAFTSGLIAASATQLVITFVQVAWPFINGPAITYTIDVSNDSGNTWRAISAGDISDTPGTVTFGVGLPNVGSATRKVRLPYNFAKALTVSGSLQAN